MKPKSLLHILFFFVLLGATFFLLFNDSARASMRIYAQSSDIPILIYEDSGLGFQSRYLKIVTLTCTSGDLNTTNNRIVIHDSGGEFFFVSNESVTIEFTYDVDNVKIRGQQNTTEFRHVPTNSSVEIAKNDKVFIVWDIFIKEWFPLMFCFGMFGFVAMIGGPVWLVKSAKKRNMKSVVNALIVTTVGIAFVIAWLWG